MSILRKLMTAVSCSILTIVMASSSFAQSVLSEPSDDADKTGTVVSVTPEENSLAVKLDDERTIDVYSISDATEITVRGNSGDLADLTAGDRIFLNFSEGADNKRTARSINQDRTPADKSAEVLEVDTTGRELTVRFDETNAVETYFIDTDTDIWVRGRPSQLNDVREGDEVILDFEEREDNRSVIRWVTYNVYPLEGMLLADSGSAEPSAQQGTLSRLPSTASPIPLIGLTGLVLIGFASLLRIRRRKTS